MDELTNKSNADIYSSVIKAGKRTYFFDVKQTKMGEKYLTITESKRCFDEFQNKFYYEKHKIFLYREDFTNFIEGLSDAVAFINSEEKVFNHNDIRSEAFSGTNSIDEDLI